MNEKIKVSPSLEDYLETIYFLFQKNPSVRVTDVAAELNISKPSVNKAINLLKSRGYVDHEHYGLLSLTPEGISIAKSVAHRHHTIVDFLTKVLKIDNIDAEKEACKLEHSMRAETVEKLAEFVKSYTQTI